MLFLSYRQPLFYDAILQEDRFVEWLSAAFFIAAGVARITDAIKRRRLFDLLVGAFCIFVGGEEFSWGQRLLGFTPPDLFLEHNVQQEFTLHNFAEVFGKPKGVLILALLGYGAGAPLIARFRRIGASGVPLAIAIWLIIAAALLIWYPVDLTGEWVEAFAGFLFLASAPVPFRQRVIGALSALVFATVLTVISARLATGGPAAVQCARAEATAILADIVNDVDRYPDLLDRNVHKRVFTAMQDGYVGTEWPRLAAAGCGSERRRSYLVDPWGMAYWVRSRRLDDKVRITVYSFGPNRNRDAHDVSVTTEVPRPAD
jgi:hypothetical protein